jgi:ABC-2 type transport system ATP-binding protein
MPPAEAVGPTTDSWGADAAGAGRTDLHGKVDAASDLAVSVHGLTKSYGSFEALRGIDFEVHRGEVLALLGPNGAGKTTAVEILEGYRKRDGGTVSVLGLDPERRDRGLRARVGIVLQECAVEPYLTVVEAMTQRAGLYPSPRAVGEVIELVGLVAKATARVKTLSGGQQRRLDLGLALVGNPELIFLDEPTTGFDPSARREAWDVVRGLCAEGRTVVLTTHYMDEAQALADTVTVIAAGRVVASGPPDTLGGRDHGATTVRFELPVGVSATDLPLPSGLTPSVRGAIVEVHVAEPTAVLHSLTQWALQRGEVLTGLTVNRPSLEDVYLALTGGPDR